MNTTTIDEKQERKVTSRLAGLEYLTLRDYKNLLWRRKAIIVAITVITASIVCLAAYRIPNEYLASTTIMVDPGRVPESYVKSTATIDANQRLALLQEQILSETRLGQIADDVGLYKNPKSAPSRDQMAEMMRKKISIDPTLTPPPAKALKSFNVSFTSLNPILAARVSNRLASLFIEENLKVREQQVMGTAAFFENQLQKAKDGVDEKAQALAELKARYATQLPESQNLHLQALTSAQLALREEQDATSRAEQQKAALELQLQSSPAVVNLDAVGGTSNTGLQEQLERMQAEMGELRSHYGPEYPDVLTKAADIENLQKKIKDLADQGLLDANKNKHNNPALESQIAQMGEQIRKHQARQAELESQIKFHVAAIGGVPKVQEEVAAANNDLVVAQDRYKRLEDRKFGADMFSDVEARQQGERFVLVDPAQPPAQPVTPNRLLIDSIGAGAGLILSLIVIAVIELIDPAVKTEREVQDLLKAPIFGEIPILSTKSRSRKRRIWSGLTAAANLLLTVGYAGLLVMSLKK
jgi:succinoglycan biosynthesis transport protein ExoP